MDRFDPDTADSVSVVIPTYNRVATLPRAMRSVLLQTHANLELIVADDASTDGTEQMVRTWAETDSRIVYRRQDTNQGASAARNLGLSAARGAFVAFQDSDDEWLLDKLDIQLRALMEGGESYGATFGIKVIYGHDEANTYGPSRVSVAPDRRRPVTSGELTSQLLKGNLISPQTLLLRRAVADAMPGFDRRLPCNNDFDYMLSLSRRTPILHTPVPVVLSYVSADSIHTRLASKIRSFAMILRKHEELFAQDPVARAQHLYSLGRYLHKAGRPRAADICLRRALWLDPAHGRAWAALVIGFARAPGLVFRGLGRRKPPRGRQSARPSQEAEVRRVG